MPFNFSPTPYSQGGGVYDPFITYGRIMSGTPSGPGAGADFTAGENLRQYVGANNPYVQRTQLFNGILSKLFGTGAGGEGGSMGAPSVPAAPAFDPSAINEQAKNLAAQRLAQVKPQFDIQAEKAREVLRRNLLSQGGEGALSSGQGTSALAQLESELAGQYGGLAASTEKGAYDPLLSALTSAYTANLGYLGGAYGSNVNLYNILSQRPLQYLQLLSGMV